MFFTNATYLADLNSAAEQVVNLAILKNAKILITGASGTIGSFLIDTLLYASEQHELNLHIYAAGRHVETLRNRFFGFPDTDISLVSYDIKEEIAFDFDIDYIVHAGGNAHPAAFNADPVGTLLDSIAGTYRLLLFGLQHKAKRFLYISSGEVYGQGNSTMDFFSECYSGYLDPTAPRSCYPMGKRGAENLCASFTKQYGLESVIVRPCHTYGPGMTRSDSRAHAQFFRNALAGNDIVLKSAGNQLRSYAYVADCISGLLTVLTSGKACEAYNLANPNSRVTIAQFAEIVAKNAGVKVVFADPSALDIANRSPFEKQVLDVQKLESLGWKGIFDTEAGIAHTLQILGETSCWNR